tara:strand:+ start:89 stop:421 length:333 start_codon:yes stop_codon:yes gene_type:complete
MAEQHRATARQWRDVKALGYDIVTYSCLLELRDRIEALESAAKPNYLEKPDSSLVARVACAIYPDGSGDGFREEARAAIREVAAWLREQKAYTFGHGWAARLDQEAKRHC